MKTRLKRRKNMESVGVSEGLREREREDEDVQKANFSQGVNM